MKVRAVLLLALLLIGWQTPGRAQNPSLAPSNLDFTRGIVQRFHYASWVSIETAENQYDKYQYDHYPASSSRTETERIKSSDGTFARKSGGNWLKSDDWGDTGTPVDADMANQLNTYATIVQLQFAKPEDHDPTQGASVWKFISQSNDKQFTLYTYERSREHPNPNGIYPRYTFMKAGGDTDGKLFLRQSTGQLRSGDSRIPFTVRLIYLIPIPPGSKVQVFDKETKQVKYQTVTDKDSGWEITTPRSAPPSDDAPLANVSAPVGDFSPGDTTNTPSSVGGN